MEYYSSIFGPYYKEGWLSLLSGNFDLAFK